MSIKINKNGKEYPVGVIPKNYPASLIQMANGESVEDVLSIKSVEFTNVLIPASNIGYVQDTSLKNKAIVGVSVPGGSSVPAVLQSFYSDDTYGITVVFRNLTSSLTQFPKVVVYYLDN